MKVDPQLICVGPERARRAADISLSDQGSFVAENPPDAVLRTNEPRWPIGAIHALRESGLRIPEDMGRHGL